MKTNAGVERVNVGSTAFWGATLLFFVLAAGCARGFDVSNLKCSKDDSCPTGYACSAAGRCVPRNTVDASSSDQSGSSHQGGNAGSDGKGVAGSSGAGAGGGTAGASDAPFGGAGGSGDTNPAGAGGTSTDVPLAPSPGVSCASAEDCTGGNCVDGVCCDGPCAGQCQSCNQPGSVGKCKVVTGAPVGGRSACGGTGVCQGRCDGSDGTTCAYPDSSTVCTAGTCTGGKVTTASVCDGAGTCSTAASSTCPSSQCAADGSAKCATSCTTSSCGAGAYCDSTGACLPMLANGSSCSAGAQCSSGYCVEGICCDGKCDGQCESCKQAGSVGKCAAVKGDPLPTRTACGGTGVCKGQCDGTNGAACAFPGSSTICTAASCANGTATTASVCNGAGACTTTTTSPCSTNLCASDGSGKCSGSCSAASCPTGSYCDSTGTCTKTLGNGGTCASAAQCTSGYCVDGVCCDGKCDGQCQSCKAGGSVGKCSAVSGDPVSPRAACGGTGKCKAQCDGSNGQACKYPDSSTVCTPASCAAGQLTTASVCNGSGSCTASTTNGCTSNLCKSDGSGCADSCTASSCGAGTYCSSGACTPTLGPGKPCSGDVQCTSGHCADGVCCDTACTQQCRACNLSGSVGTCSRVTNGAPAAGHSACTGSGTCGGTCNGSSDACFYPTSTQSCGPAASCSTDLTSYSSSACNGQGTCSAATSTPCGSTNYCSGGACVSKITTIGVACQQSIQCQSGNCATSGTGGICCQSGYSNCGGSCTNVNGSDVANCGGCGTRCGTGQTCNSGHCACPNSQTLCAGACTDTSSDPNNCGRCGTLCGTGKSCSGGACGCPLGAATLCGTCAVWTFNDGTSSGWNSGVGVRGNACNVLSFGVQSPTTTPTALDGQAMEMVFTGASGGCGAGMGVSLCGGSGVSLGGRTLHASVYYVPGNGATSSTFPGTIFAYAETFGGGVDSSPPMSTSLSAYSWTPISATFANTGATDLYVGITFFPNDDSGGGGQELWFDNIYLQ